MINHISFSVIPVLVIFLFILFTFFISFRTQRRRRNQLCWMISFLRSVRKIIQHLPQHRGMGNAYLRGDDSFKEKMKEMQDKINSDFSELLIITEKSSSVFDLNVIATVNSAWKEIEEKAFLFSPEESFAKHTALIADVLNIIEESNELASLQSGFEEFELILRALVKDIPYLTETLGQARGLGTGISAQEECSVANRLKLGFLHQKGMKVLNETIHPLIDSKLPQLNSSKSAIENCLEKSNKFLACMNSELIQADKIVIQPTIFYGIATEAIDHTFVLLDQLLNVLEGIVLQK